MTPRDNVEPSSTVRPAAHGVNTVTTRAMPEETVLSTIWVGPPNGSAEPSGDRTGDAQDPRTLRVVRPTLRARILDWMVSPATRRRGLIVTTIAAVTCAVLVTAGELIGESEPNIPGPAASSGALLSESVATAPSDVSDADESSSPPVAARASSADQRLELTVEPLLTGARTWMIEAELTEVADAESQAVVQFAVNGFAVEEVSHAPYRLLLNPELLASRPELADDDRPSLIVTATARRTSGETLIGPATVVVSTESG